MQIGWDWEDEIAGFWLTGLGYRRMRGGEVGSCLQRLRWYLWYTQDWMILTPKLLPLQFLLGLGLGKWSLSMHIPFYYKILQISRLVSKINILFSHPTWWFTPVSKWLVRPLAIPEVKHQAIPSPSYETPPVTMVYSLGNKRIHFFCGKKVFFVVEDFIYIYICILYLSILAQQWGRDWQIPTAGDQVRSLVVLTTRGPNPHRPGWRTLGSAGLEALQLMAVVTGSFFFLPLALIYAYRHVCKCKCKCKCKYVM